MLASRLRPILPFALVPLFTVFAYTFLHEGGHALVALLAGATVTAFSVNFLNLSAHVSFAGVLTPLQAIVNNLAGAALPLLIWLGFILAVPRRANLALELLKLVGSLVCLSTLLAWIALPLLHLAGRAPSDDVTSFLNNSGAHPLLVSAAALLLLAAGSALCLRRIEPLPRLLARFRTLGPESFTPAAGRTVLALAGVFVLFTLAALALNGFRLTAPARDPFLPPPPYRPVATLDVSGAARDAEVIYAFHLAEAQTVGLYLLISEMDAALFDVTLAGPGAERRVILHGEGYTPTRDRARLEETLPPGDYQLLLTARAKRGTVTLYVDLR